MITLTPEQLFLRYAYPCADARFLAKKMRAEHRDEIEALVASNGQPRRRLLKYCFPQAFKRLRQLGMRREKDWWSLSVVTAYWRNHSGHGGDCRVQYATVIESDGRIATVACLGKKFRAANPYRLELPERARITIHRLVVVENLDT